MNSSYHATMVKSGDRWLYRVFEGWGTLASEVIVQGTNSDWMTAFCQAAGTVSAFRSAYEYHYTESRPGDDRLRPPAG